MAVMKNEDGTSIAVDCSCGCCEGLNIKIDKQNFDTYAILTYTNANFYRDQNLIFGRFLQLS